MTALTPPPERVCRHCGSADNLKMVFDVLGATYKSWECRGGCRGVTADHPTYVPVTRADSALYVHHCGATVWALLPEPATSACPTCHAAGGWTPAYVRGDGGAEPGRGVLDEIAAERARQNAKWGEQNHPDGTGPALRWQLPSGMFAADSVAYAKRTCQWAADEGRTTWMLILREEIAEAFAEDDPARLRAELVQVAAVAAQWAEAIDRRGGDPR